MEKLELEHNDYITNIIVFTLKNNQPQYYFSNKEDWFMDNWIYTFSNGDAYFIEAALKKLSKDKIPFHEIYEECKRLKFEDKRHVIFCNLPVLYIDFDREILKSRYQDQILHSKIINGWNGSFNEFLDDIPKGLNYWDEFI